MSYCRFTVADVYVFHNTSGRLECCGCIIEGESILFATYSGMIDHLREHQDAGHHVPSYVIHALTGDAIECGDDVGEEAGPNA